MTDEEYLKIKELKYEYNVSWGEFIKYANRVLSGGMKNDDTKK